MGALGLCRSSGDPERHHLWRRHDRHRHLVCAGVHELIDRILYGGPTSPAPTLPASGELKVYVIDVGQGESILITTEENSLLIDAGENDKGDEVLDFINQLGLTELDYVLATHPDSDHIGGMDTVLENIDVPGGVFFGEMPDDLIPTTKTYEDVLDVIEEKDIPLFTAAAGDTIDLGKRRSADRSGAGGPAGSRQQKQHLAGHPPGLWRKLLSL